MSIKTILENAAQGEWNQIAGRSPRQVYYTTDESDTVWIADCSCSEDADYFVAYQPAHTELLEALLYAAEDALEIRLEDDGLDELDKTVKAVNSWRERKGLL